MKQAIVALGLVEWEAAFVSGLGHPMLGVSVARRCVDGIDVRAAVQVVATDLVVVSDYTPRIDQDLMNELLDRNISVVAIGDDENYWQDFGVSHFIKQDLENPLTAIKYLAEALRDPISVSESSQAPKGELIAVAGFGGACGRSTLVKEVSWQLAQAGKKTLMADADSYGPSLLQELGGEVSVGGILEVCREFEKRNLAKNPFESMTQQIDSNLSLLAGLSRTSRWTDLRIPALRLTWENAVRSFDSVVVDVGGVLEIDQSLMHESALPRRLAASLTALDAAGSAILCARADSVGISRLIRGYLEFHELFADTNISVAVWGTTDGRHATEVERAISRHTGLQKITCVPHDWKIAQDTLAVSGIMSAMHPKSEVANSYKLIANSFLQSEAKVLPMKSKERARFGIRNKRAA
jgi:MinD-like ATPase involved in chromosome partitioning or flagellar assembly